MYTVWPTDSSAYIGMKIAFMLMNTFPGAMMPIFSLFLSLLACDKSQSNNTDENESYMPYCAETETALERDEMSPIGVSMDMVLDQLAMNYSKNLVWADGEESCLSGAVSPDESTIRFVESTEVYPEAPPDAMVPAIAVDCPDYIAMDGLVSIMTHDGLLDEELQVTFTVSEEDVLDTADMVNAKYSIDIDAFNGTYAPSADDEISSITISGEVGGVFSGSISMVTTNESDSGIVMANIVDIASWSEAADPECPGFE